MLHSIVIKDKKLSSTLSSSIEENTLQFVISFDELRKDVKQLNSIEQWMKPGIANPVTP